MLKFLPQKIYRIIKSYNIDAINEVRLRANCSPTLIVNGVSVFIKKYIVTFCDIEETVLNACKHSIYSYDEDIKNGFITTDEGERIGLAGEFVFENGSVKAIRKFSSLVIRIPKNVIGFANSFYYNYFKGGSVLVVSKTGGGKTTFIRDLTSLISAGNLGSIIVVDERNEICSNNLGNNFYLGENVDVLTYCTKDYGFSQAIRTLNPNYIVTDEIMCENDCNGLIRAYNCGVNIIATLHASSISKILEIDYMKNVIKKRCFDYYVFIENCKGTRSLFVYDKDFNEKCLY